MRIIIIIAAICLLGAAIQLLSSCASNKPKECEWTCIGPKVPEQCYCINEMIEDDEQEKSDD